MKVIRRTRITVRKSEKIIIKNGANNVHLEETEMHVCPLCHSPIYSKSPIPIAVRDEKLLTGIKNLLTEEN